MRLVKPINTTLMITGGTGSLGNAIVEKLLSPGNGGGFEKIIIFSRDERKQEDMFLRWRDKDRDNRLRYFIGDIRDKQRLKLATRDVTHIIHAAALKIVPTVEYNASEAIATNITGSQNLIEVAHEHPHIEKLLAVSTDKAVSPTNLYGSTKLAMEKLFTSANQYNKEYGPKFSVVRYGNVSGSRGSVIPLFQSQLANRAQITITDERMTRFWITLDDARDFVLRALSLMNGDETFIPNMPTYRIKDLAEIFAGKEPIKTIGIRPGEKIHEEVMSEHEVPYSYDWYLDYVLLRKANEKVLKELASLGLPTRGFTSETQVMRKDQLENLLRKNGFLNHLDFYEPKEDEPNYEASEI